MKVKLLWFFVLAVAVFAGGVMSQETQENTPYYIENADTALNLHAGDSGPGALGSIEDCGSPGGDADCQRKVETAATAYTWTSAAKPPAGTVSAGTWPEYAYMQADVVRAGKDYHGNWMTVCKAGKSIGNIHGSYGNFGDYHGDTQKRLNCDRAGGSGRDKVHILRGTGSWVSAKSPPAGSELPGGGISCKAQYDYDRWYAGTWVGDKCLAVRSGSRNHSTKNVYFFVPEKVSWHLPYEVVGTKQVYICRGKSNLLNVGQWDLTVGQCVARPGGSLEVLTEPEFLVFADPSKAIWVVGTSAANAVDGGPIYDGGRRMTICRNGPMSGNGDGYSAGSIYSGSCDSAWVGTYPYGRTEVLTVVK
jgi:hypothetical protein